MDKPATEITLATVDFLQLAAIPGSTVQWVVWPSGHRFFRAELCEALESMPKPVIVSVHVEPGAVTATPLEAASPEARPWLEHEWRNQTAYLNEKLALVSPNVESVHVLLELDGRELIFSASDLRAWARDYVVTSCGWTLADSHGDGRAPVRMFLRRPDGTWSPGMSRHRGEAAT